VMPAGTAAIELKGSAVQQMQARAKRCRAVQWRASMIRFNN